MVDPRSRPIIKEMPRGSSKIEDRRDCLRRLALVLPALERFERREKAGGVSGREWFKANRWRGARP